MSERIDDRSDLPFLPRRLIAAHEIAQAEFVRTNVHEQVTIHETANLDCIDMQGEWDAADAFEAGLYPRMASFMEVGYDTMERLRRTDPEAKIVVTIPVGLTAEQGYVALQRKRLFIRLTSESDNVPTLHVDKISMFALDINRLAGLSQGAAREVRLIVAGAMYLAINQAALERNDFGIAAQEREWFEDMSARMGRTEPAFLEALENQKLFHEALVRYGMTTEEVLERLLGDDPIRLHDPTSLAFVEEALHTRSELLTPAATTYYVHS